jgi:hypothetical protein
MSSIKCLPQVLWEQRLNVMREVADWLAKYDKELVACRYTFPESRSVLSVPQIASCFCAGTYPLRLELIQC